MGRSCTICIHPAYDAIDAALEAGQPLRQIAAKYGTSKTTLHRHWHMHTVQESSPLTNGGALMRTKRRSRVSIIAKWALVVGFGLLLSIAAMRTYSGQIP